MTKHTNTMKVQNGKWLKEFPLNYATQQFQDRARKNHDQSLEKIDNRGGLSPCELACILLDCKYREYPEAEVALMELILRVEGFDANSQRIELQS